MKNHGAGGFIGDPPPQDNCGKKEDLPRNTFLGAFFKKVVRQIKKNSCKKCHNIINLNLI